VDKGTCSKNKKRKKFYYVPIISYSSETGMLLGLATDIVFYDEISSSSNEPFFRPSSLKPTFSYGFKGQLQMEVLGSYFGVNDWYFKNQISFRKDNWSSFFGIGDNINDDIYSIYQNNIFKWSGEVLKILDQRFFVGAKYHFRTDTSFKYNEEVNLIIPDSSGG